MAFDNYLKVLDSLEIGVFVITSYGKIIYANSFFLKDIGYSLEELDSQLNFFWSLGDSVTWYKEALKEASLKPGVIKGEVNHLRKDGSFCRAEVKINFINSNEGDGFVVLARDVSYEKELNKSQSEFISLASHQLRTPLSIINWYVSELLTDANFNLSAEATKYISEIKKGNTRMINLVEDLLNVSKIESRSFAVYLEAVSINDAMHKVIEGFAIDSQKKFINIETNLFKNLPTLQLDQKIINLVLKNLLANAIKYSNNNGFIKITTEIDKDNVLVSIEDNGIGIPEEERISLFSRFFRASNAKKIDGEGSGLSLYLTKQLLEAVGSSISFYPAKLGGSIFCVKIPLSGMKAR